MPRPPAQDERDRKFFDKIDRHGWAVTQVYSDDEEPPFCYSTGIHERTGRAELIVIGLAPETGGWVINEYGDRILKGETFEPGGLYEGFLEGALATFIEATKPAAVADYATWTDWYYERKGFPLYQFIYPDKSTGAFPWQEGYRESWLRLQPLLGAPPILRS